ncbi:MAG: HlyD family efflux transporter periplasmic adaptor subunit [Breznakibacter sp.]
MKKLILTILPFVLWSCGKGNEKSDAYGNFESTEFTVSAEVTGKIIQSSFNEGDAVNQGDLLCLIDTVPLHLQKLQLDASKKSVVTGLRKVTTAIDVLMAQKRIAENDLARLRQMAADHAATPKQTDDAAGQLSVIQKQIDNTAAQIASVNAEIEVIDTKIASVDDQLGRCRVTAPIRGTVLNKLAELGELTSAGKPVAKLAGLDQMELRAYVSGDMLPQVKIGQSVTVLIDRDGKTNDKLGGIVTWISPTAEFTPKIIQTKKERVNQVYAFKVTVKNDGRIKIGMPGEVMLQPLAQ